MKFVRTAWEDAECWNIFRDKSEKNRECWSLYFV